MKNCVKDSALQRQTDERHALHNRTLRWRSDELYSQWISLMLFPRLPYNVSRSASYTSSLSTEVTWIHNSR